MFLGQLAYPAAKAQGDKSMPEKRRPPGGVHDGAPQDPRDMAKAGNPISSGESDAPIGTTPETDARAMPRHEP